MTRPILEITEIKTELVIGAGDAPLVVLEINEPRIEILTVGIQGPSGVDGFGQNQLDYKYLLAAETVSGHTPVRSTSDGAISKITPTAADEIYSTLGITTGAILQGEVGDVRGFGLMIEPTWNWLPGKPIFLSATGGLTQDAPISGYLLEIARALTATKILISVKNPILLI